MAKQADTTISVPQIQKGRIVVSVLGTSPLICNRMSEKAKHELLMPGGRKNAAERQVRLKHDPLAEFRASPYTLSGPEALTYLAVMSVGFKRALTTAALDLPGTKKAQIGRLVYLEGEYTPVYGLPRLRMDVVRMADIGRTPDIRTRVTLPRWACQIVVTFVQPLLTPQSIVNLLTAAGVTVGIGDYRPEKGAGNYGQFQIVNPDDPEFVAVCQEGRAVQVAAMKAPEAYDSETAEMLAYWGAEGKRRGFETVA